jgi:uncharacterized protein (DUF2141 family)
MKPSSLIPALASAFLLAHWAPASAARDVGVLVSGIADESGELICRLYGGEKGFPQNEGDIVQTVRYPVSSSLMTCTFPGVAPGRYAVSVMHDANGNGEFDKNFMGFPKEPWGVSNNVRPDSRSPRFGEASIHISEDKLASFEVVLDR